MVKWYHVHGVWQRVDAQQLLAPLLSFPQVFLFLDFFLKKLIGVFIYNGTGQTHAYVHVEVRGQPCEVVFFSFHFYVGSGI